MPNCKLVLQVKVQHNRLLIFEMVKTVDNKILEVELKEDLGMVQIQIVYINYIYELLI